MQSLDDKIFSVLKKCGRGTIFSSADFRSYGAADSVAKAITRMAESGTIIRVARGIFCYPKIDKLLGLGIIKPTLDEIAQYVAKRDKARIVPTGVYALNILGLSQQVPMKVVYLTDGTHRHLSVYGDSTINFKMTAPKNLAFTNKLAMLITFALKELGEGNITPEQENILKALLTNENKQLIEKDYRLMPAWIQKMIMKLYE